MSKIYTLVLFLSLIFAAQSQAANRSMSRMSDYSSSGSSTGQKMMVDASAHYIRDTRPEASTDTGMRFSIGGTFSSWVGLDIVGMYAVKSKNNLVGADLRLMPTDWFFIKGGIGAYSDKVSRELKGTPLAGTGIMANLGDGFYLVSEFTYFERNKNKNVTMGAGLGMFF